MNTKLTTMIAAVLLMSYQSVLAVPWQPAGDHIMTEWAEGVTPANVHREYPRPQMVRKDWKSLNGLWDYAIVPSSASMPLEPDGKILVPFSVESALSGVGKTVGQNDALWYMTHFSISRSWRKKNVRLNFEAVDWKAEVYVNDILVGVHTGGYAPFSFDISSALRQGRRQKLVVKVTDATNKSLQPHGKQTLRPHGIWYTAVTGIWQSVWLEPVDKGGIDGYYAVSDIDAGTMAVSVEKSFPEDGSIIKVDLLDGGIGYSTENKSKARIISSVKALPGNKIIFQVSDMKVWSPEHPYLYGLRISVLKDGKVLDAVRGYTAMRKSSVVVDSLGHKRLGLNNKPVFEFGPLDQGWWPDGLYTAPTDDAMKYDIEKIKAFGFNMVRKHIKVEPARWYYYCDQLGLMVWQDMPSIADNSKNEWGVDAMGEGTDYPVSEWGKANYYKEWAEIIASRKNFQSIVVWVPFNEAWGQFDTEKAVDFTRSLDGTRLINSASGGNHRECGDIMDVHHYPEPKMLMWDGNEVNVLGEYGGIGFPVSGHLWQNDKNWGYVKFSDVDEVTDTYEKYADILINLISQGCSGGVYTQITDVEGEVNGIMTYDRKVIKMDEARLKKINEKVINSLGE
jgi:beta-galactosidase/beta-glucuronidase